MKNKKSSVFLQKNPEKSSFYPLVKMRELVQKFLCKMTKRLAALIHVSLISKIISNKGSSKESDCKDRKSLPLRKALLAEYTIHKQK